MKWLTNHESDPIIAVADAKGVINLYKMNKENLLEPFARHKITDDDDDTKILALSLDWNTRRCHQVHPKLAISCSNGNIYILDLRDSSLTLISKSSNLHSFEAWITAFDAWNDDVIYSGGDDCSMKVLDIRSPDVFALKANSKHHTAGVTSLLSDVYSEHHLYSGR